MERTSSEKLIDERRQNVAVFINEKLRPASTLLGDDLEVLRDNDPTDSGTDFEVREYQLDAWANLWETRKQGKQRALVHLATGLGKTSVAVFDVMKFRQEQADQQEGSPRVLFVSHRHEISEQARERFIHFMPDVHTAYFRTKQKKLPDADITFATFQSLNSELDRFNPKGFDYIIYDEAHHSEAQTFKRVREYFAPLFELALTATPNRMDEKDIREYFGEPAYRKSLGEAMAEGWLANVDYHIVFDDIVKQMMEEGFEPKTLREFHELFKIRPRNEIIAKNILEERHKIGLDEAKTIIFCEDVTHAEEMSELLNAVAYHSKIPKSYRRQILEDFRQGSHQVICTVDMFNEGIDIPDARLIVFLRSTVSGTVFDQQLGRGLRRAPGKDRVSVLDFVANIERILKVKELSDSLVRSGRQIDQSNNAEPDSGTSEAGGLRVYSQHGQFDFDRLSINLLEIYGSFKREEREYNPINDLSDEHIIELALVLKPKAPLSQKEIDELSKNRQFISATALSRRFGGLLKFHEACGFDPTDTRLLSNDDIVELAKSLSPDQPLKSSQIDELSKKKLFISKSAIKSRFGSISNFHEACGFGIRKGQFDLNTITAQEIVELALDLSPNEPLSTTDINRLYKEGKFISNHWVYRFFGSINEFGRACGFERISAESLSNAEIIDWAKRLSQDTPLSQTRIGELSAKNEFPSAPYIQKRFGSLVKFQQACGFDVIEKAHRQFNVKSLDNQAVIGLALRIKPTNPLGQKEIERLSKKGEFVSMALIRKMFGSLTEFQQACGFEMTTKLKSSERIGELTKDEAMALALEISPDKPLTKRDIETLSTEGKFIGSKRVKNLFGTISEFQIACGFQANKPFSGK